VAIGDVRGGDGQTGESVALLLMGVALTGAAFAARRRTRTR